MKAELELVRSNERKTGVSASDDILMSRCAGDDEKAFSTLVQRHQSLMVGLASKYLGDRVLAEEACQEAFARLWQLRRDYEPRGYFRAYLSKLCINSCRELSRSSRRRRAAMERYAAEYSRPQLNMDDSALDRLANEQAAERLVAGLPRNQKEAVLLRFFGELSYREMAGALGRPEVTLRAWVHRALKGLEPAFIELGLEP